MDQFPPGFSDAHYKIIKDIHDNDEKLKRGEKLKEMRKKIYDTINSDLTRFQTRSVFEFPDDFPSEDRLVLIKELIPRFSDIQYWKNFEYQDSNNFLPIDRKNPQISWQYCIIFPK